MDIQQLLVEYVIQYGEEKKRRKKKKKKKERSWNSCFQDVNIPHFCFVAPVAVSCCIRNRAIRNIASCFPFEQAQCSFQTSSGKQTNRGRVQLNHLSKACHLPSSATAACAESVRPHWQKLAGQTGLTPHQHPSPCKTGHTQMNVYNLNSPNIVRQAIHLLATPHRLQQQVKKNHPPPKKNLKWQMASRCLTKRAMRSKANLNWEFCFKRL